MALKFYDEVGSTTAYSLGGLFTNPQIVSLDGRTGGVVEQRVYVRNEDAATTYSNIQMMLYQSGGSISYVDGSSGYSMKLKSGSTRPTPAEWVTITADNTISLSDISNTNTYLPVWVRFEFPARVAVQHISNVSLKLTATEATP